MKRFRAGTLSLVTLGLVLAGCVLPYRSSTMTTGPVDAGALKGARFSFYVCDLQRNPQGAWETAYRNGDKEEVIDAKAFVFWVDHGNNVGSPPVQSFHIIRVEVTRDDRAVTLKSIPVQESNPLPSTSPYRLVRGIEYWVLADSDLGKPELPEIPAGHYRIKIHYEMEGKEYDVSFEADYRHGVRWQKIWEMPVC
jgi:hypothetical protein